MTSLMAAFFLAAACVSPASAGQAGPEATSLEGALAEALGAARAAVYQELIRRVSADAAPNETGLIDIPVRAVGGGASVSFTKGQCLFCTRYREQAETMAKERAKANAEAICESKRGFLSREPEAEVTDCVRVDGWTSYYLCGARAWGVCLAPIPR